jgi:hypothetical protein
LVPVPTEQLMCLTATQPCPEEMDVTRKCNKQTRRAFFIFFKIQIKAKISTIFLSQYLIPVKYFFEFLSIQ